MLIYIKLDTKFLHRLVSENWFFDIILKKYCSWSWLNPVAFKRLLVPFLCLMTPNSLTKEKHNEEFTKWCWTFYCIKSTWVEFKINLSLLFGTSCASLVPEQDYFMLIRILVSSITLFFFIYHSSPGNVLFRFSKSEIMLYWKPYVAFLEKQQVFVLHCQR